jgi:WD40 repeat protein
VLTASADKTARVWDAETAKQLLVLTGHARDVTAASFSPEGRRVLTASDDGTVRIWPLDPLAVAERRKPRDLTPKEIERYRITPLPEGR